MTSIATTLQPRSPTFGPPQTGDPLAPWPLILSVSADHCHLPSQSCWMRLALPLCSRVGAAATAGMLLATTSVDGQATNIFSLSSAMEDRPNRVVPCHVYVTRLLHPPHR